MRRNIILTMVLLANVCLSGCSEANNEPTPQSTRLHAGDRETSNNFEKNFNTAGRFLELKHSGDAFFEQEKYVEAIDDYKVALKQYAESRPEQAMISERLGAAYAALGNKAEAAKFYDLASEVTMNQVRQIELRAISQGYLSEINDGSAENNLLSKADSLYRDAHSLLKTENYDGAILVYEKIAILDKWHARYASKKIAEAHRQSGDFNKAFMKYKEWYGGLTAGWERKKFKAEFSEYEDLASQ